MDISKKITMMDEDYEKLLDKENYDKTFSYKLNEINNSDVSDECKKALVEWANRYINRRNVRRSLMTSDSKDPVSSLEKSATSEMETICCYKKSEDTQLEIQLKPTMLTLATALISQFRP
ncbi:hypothetical protein [Methanococcoides seepicolus]|uniref:Uncharacterized protein n=1 Tax=Methanococcoides seepicolus TaxID=2828780 RepID=A0A9E4ZJK6_9EURY|nr:hypothetical protein [Methanococcoides seepicolus]MCM1987869.1 hypothetical protein [Methanococcoides seepicolus]